MGIAGSAATREQRTRGSSFSVYSFVFSRALFVVRQDHVAGVVVERVSSARREQLESSLELSVRVAACQWTAGKTAVEFHPQLRLEEAETQQPPGRMETRFFFSVIN